MCVPALRLTLHTRHCGPPTLNTYRHSPIIPYSPTTPPRNPARPEQLTHLESQLVGLAPAMSGHDVANALASLTRLAETAAAATSAGSRDGSGYSSSSSSSSSGGGIDAAEVPAPLAADEREDGPDAGAELEEGERDEGAASAAGAELEGPKGSYRPQAGTLRVLLARAASMVRRRGDGAPGLRPHGLRRHVIPPCFWGPAPPWSCSS